MPVNNCYFNVRFNEKFEVVRENGEIISDALLVRNGREIFLGQSKTTPLNTSPQNLEGEYVFGGHLIYHFGHFLLESLARICFLKESNLPILWVVPANFQGLKPWQEDIFCLLGIDVNRFQYAACATSVKQLWVQPPQYVIGGHFTERHREACACVAAEPRGGKIWMSRSALAPGLGGWINEKNIERKLQLSGWKIVRPEEISIENQIKIFAEAELVAGVEGSAFHSALLAKNVSANVIIFSRGFNANRNFFSIADVKNINQKVVSVDQVCIDPSLRPDKREYFACEDSVLRVLGGMDRAEGGSAKGESKLRLRGEYGSFLTHAEARVLQESAMLLKDLDPKKAVFLMEMAFSAFPNNVKIREKSLFFKSELDSTN